jgi:hypothetical protein
MRRLQGDHADDHPANTFSHAGLPWQQPVLLQDGATHPGTFITPVLSGS